MTEDRDDKKPGDLSRRVADGESVDWEKEEERADGTAEKRVVRGMKKLADLAADRGLDSADGGDTDDDPPTSSLHDPSPTPERIGSYKILQKLGEGGMGEVWLAEQTEPVRRRVALKVIKQGMDTKQVVARFEAERQALALMDHPAVARVFEAGATPEGRPYFAMEYVQGVPITVHCDRHKLTNDERLKLFMQVCEGVQHAHQKAIIHRDLKPSNVLVSIQDGKAVPKIIDFGVAKATAQRLTEKTVFTRLGMLIGTPEYMSPEQAEMTEQDVDTRTDVYSLGVVLYELLVGALPFDPKELRSEGYDALRRKIREEDPPRPSTRLSTLGDRSTESAKLRRVDLPTLQRQLRGDLDWITMKALEKDRTRRFGSPMELAADVERHLEHQPVLAGPPSAAYRARKFVRRHRFGVAVGTVAVVALIGFAVTMGVLARQIALEREQVEAAKDDLEQVVEFQASMLSDLDVEQLGRRLVADERERVAEAFRERGETEGKIEARLASLDESLGSVNATDVALRLIDEEILDRAGKTIDEQFAEQPLVAATLRQVIADTYEELGLFERARPYGESALATRRELLGDDHPSTLTSISKTSLLLRAQGKLEEAELYCREALEDRTRVLGEDDPATLASLGNLGLLLQDQGKLEEAEPLLREALEGERRVLGDDHPYTLGSINYLGLLLNARGKLEEAESYYREALEGRTRVLGEDDPATLASLGNLGLLLKAQGKLQEAEVYLRGALEGNRRVLGNDHPSTLASINNLGMLLRAQGKLREAEPYYREALQGARRVLDDDHPYTLAGINNLGLLLHAQGKLQEAEPYLREALEGARHVLGDDHPSTLNTINSLGGLLQAQGRLEEAETYWRKALDAFRRVLGDDHPSTLNSVDNLGGLLHLQGDSEEAESYVREALEGRKRVLGNDHPETLRSMNNVGFLLRAQGKLEEAEPYLREALEIRRRIRGEEHPETLTSMINMASLLRDQGKLEEAEPYYREALDGRRRVLGDDHLSTLIAIRDMGRLLREQRKFEEAEDLLAPAVESVRRVLPREHGGTASVLFHHGASLTALGRHAEAEPELLEAHEIVTAVVGADHENTQKVVRVLVELYEAWGKPEKAEEWRTKVADEGE